MQRLSFLTDRTEALVTDGGGFGRMWEFSLSGPFCDVFTPSCVRTNGCNADVTAAPKDCITAVAEADCGLRLVTALVVSLIRAY